MGRTVRISPRLLYSYVYSFTSLFLLGAAQQSNQSVCKRTEKELWESWANIIYGLKWTKLKFSWIYSSCKFLNTFFLGSSKNLHCKLPLVSNQAQYRKRNKTDPHGCNYYWNSTVKHQSIHTALNSTILQVRVNAATYLTTTWYVSLFALLLLSIEMLHCKLFSIVSHLCYFTLRVGFIFCCCCCINLTTVGHSKNAVCRSQKLHHAIDRIFLRFLFSFLFLHSRSIWITFRFSVNCCVNVMFVSQLCYFLCWKVMDVEVFMSLVCLQYFIQWKTSLKAMKYIKEVLKPPASNC